MTMETYLLDNDLRGYQSPHIGRAQHHQIMTVFCDIRGVKQQMAKYNPMALILQDPVQYEREVKPLIEHHQRLLAELQMLYPHRDICTRYSYNIYLHLERKYGISPKTKLEALQFFGYTQNVVLPSKPTGWYRDDDSIQYRPISGVHVHTIQWDRWYNHKKETFLLAYAKPIDTLFYNSRD